MDPELPLKSGVGGAVELRRGLLSEGVATTRVTKKDKAVETRHCRVSLSNRRLYLGYPARCGRVRTLRRGSATSLQPRISASRGFRRCDNLREKTIFVKN